MEHAASAFLSFSENCPPDIMKWYLHSISIKLLEQQENGNQMVPEAAQTALRHIRWRYDITMPRLKAILKNNDESNRMPLAGSWQCISLVSMSVGKNEFRDDAKQFMKVLISLERFQMMKTFDPKPKPNSMLQACARLCKCLDEDFLPFMNVVMPALLQSAQLKPDVTIPSADSDDDIDKSDDESIETITVGDNRIGIRTSVLEEKATACNMLCCYADELKERFYPWIDQVAPTLVPLLKSYFHEKVRKAAVSAIQELLRSAKLAVEKGQAPGRDESYVKQLSDYIIPALVEAMHEEPETEICASMLDSLNKCIQLSGPLIDGGQVRLIVDEIKHVITASTTRKRERAERTRAGDCLGTLIKTFKASFLPFFDELSVYITPMWGTDKTAEERRIAICIFGDVAEQYITVHFFHPCSKHAMMGMQMFARLLFMESVSALNTVARRFGLLLEGPFPR